jgi:hypothetical protein
MVGELMKAPEDPDAFDPFNPKHVSPLVAYLASADCPLNGKMFSVQGGAINELTNWTIGDAIENQGDWTVDLIAEKLGTLAAA